MAGIKGRKWSKEALKNHKGMSGKKHSDKTKEKIGKANSIALKGRVMPEETKEKLRQSNLKSGRKPPIQKGKDCHNWKGDKVGYSALHDWVYRQLGSQQKCEHCLTIKKRTYHWANKSGKYLRKKNDWIRLCVPCHRKYDNKKKS